ncbi:MAG: hypothetical protein ACOY3Z_10585 [Thermodesulfobacteriota bacterium]
MLLTHAIRRAAGLLVVLFALLSLLAACTGASSDTSSALQPDGSRIAKGKVIEVTEAMVTIKPPAGAAVQARLTPETRYSGVAAGQIKKGQALEIRYKTEGMANTAISVTAIKEGSC